MSKEVQESKEKLKSFNVNAIIIAIPIILVILLLLLIYNTFNVKYEYTAIDGTNGIANVTNLNSTNLNVKLDDGTVIKIIKYKRIN